MHLLAVMLLLAVGSCEAETLHELTCPYELQHESLLRVWCRQSSTDCCTGLTFNHSDHFVDGVNLKVTQGSLSFTVAMLQLSHGGGMYWCGVLGTNNTVIKLAEGYFHSSCGVDIWSGPRWILLPLLPMVTIFTNLYSRAITKHVSKVEEPYQDVTDPQYENSALFCELE